VRYLIKEVDDLDWNKPAFFTERLWAADALADAECNDQELPDRAYAQGRSVCNDPIAIVYAEDYR
jgi:hypothetical protein